MPDYYEIISNPMDLSTVMKKIDEHQYNTPKQWLNDIDTITMNSLEYVIICVLDKSFRSIYTCMYYVTRSHGFYFVNRNLENVCFHLTPLLNLHSKHFMTTMIAIAIVHFVQ